MSTARQYDAFPSTFVMAGAMFSTDYPYESAEEAATWFDSATISEPDRVKIGRQNAATLFNLQPATESVSTNGRLIYN